MRVGLRWAIPTAAIGAALFLGPARAEAGLKLRIIASSVVNNVTVTNTVDYPVGTSPNGGNVNYSGTISSNSNPADTPGTRFSFDVSAFSNSPNGLDAFGDPTTFAELFARSISVGSNGAGTLTVELTDNNFAVPSPDPGNTLKSVVSTSANQTPSNVTFTYQSYADASNSNNFSMTGVTPGTQGPFGGTVSNNTAYARFPTVSGPYSLLGVATFRFTARGSASITADTTVMAPEPATLAMAVAGLPVVGLIRRQRRRRASATA